MTTKEVVIWEDGRGGQSILLNKEEIEKVVEVGESALIIEIDGVDLSVDSYFDNNLTEKLHAYIDKLEDEEKDYETDDPDFIKVFLQSIGFSNVDISFPDSFFIDSEKEKLVFDPQEKNFYVIDKGEWTTKIFSWWDGHNHRTISLDDFMNNETELVITKKFVDLDIWDGRNFSTGGHGLHQRVYKIIKIDGNEVDDHFLLEKWSQYQGDLPEGIILTADDLKEHIEKLKDRDVVELMYEAGKLSGE